MTNKLCYKGKSFRNKAFLAILTSAMYTQYFWQLIGIYWDIAIAFTSITSCCFLFLYNIQGFMENFEKLSSLIKLSLGAKHLPYLFSQVFYWNKDFCAYGEVSCLHNKAPCLAVLFEPHFGIPFHCWSWVCSDENQTSMSAFVTSRCLPPLILCQSATVIFYLWWSVFWTPTVAIHTK